MRLPGVRSHRFRLIVWVLGASIGAAIVVWSVLFATGDALPTGTHDAASVRSASKAISAPLSQRAGVGRASGATSARPLSNPGAGTVTGHLLRVGGPVPEAHNLPLSEYVSAYLDVAKPGPPIATIRSDSRGRFNVNLASGPYYFLATDSNGNQIGGPRQVRVLVGRVSDLVIIVSVR